MECFQCQSSYNDHENCPRLLISCGHSLCQKCLTQAFLQGAVACPECETITESVHLSDFPKNLALLHLKPAPLNDRRQNKSHTRDKSSESIHDASLLCKKHRKKVEAFCENDRQLLCITCILEEGYKNQDICSIQDAAQKEKNLIQKAFELSQIIEEKLKNVQKEMIETSHSLTEASERSRIEITNFFNDIRKSIAERETILKQKLSEQLKKQEGLLKKKEEKVSKHLTSILSFYEEYKQSLSESDIHLLRSSLKRIETIKKATIDVEKLDIENSFGELNRESELNTLWKLIQPISKSHHKDNAGAGAGAPAKNTKATLITQGPVMKNKTLKDTTLNKHGSFVGVRASTNFKKESASIPAVTQSHSFAFSIVDRNVNKPSQTPQNREPTKNAKEDLANNENKKPVERRHSSPVKPTTMKTKHHQGYLALRNQYKEREILKERAQANNDVMDFIENNEKLQDNKASIKPHLSLTPTKILHEQLREHSSPEDSIGSETPPPVTNALSYEPSSFNDNNRVSINEDLQFNQKWVYEPSELEKPFKDPKIGQIEQPPHSAIIKKVGGVIEADPFSMWNSGIKFDNYSINNNLSKEGKLQINKDHETTRSLDLNTNASVTEMGSRRGGSLMYDMTDISNQKLDFSVLCQQTTSHIYTMGGFIEDSQPFIEKYDVQKGRWEIAGTFMNNRTKFSSLALPEYGSILIMGGKQEGARTAVCEQYSLTDQLVLPSDITLTAPKSGFGALLLKDDIYVCGGNDGQSILKTFEAYNLKTKRWTFLPPLELKRDELSVVVGPDHKIYAIGGFGGRNNTCLSEVERYDPQKGVWESVAPMNTPRRALAAVSLPDGIYAIGGFDGDNYLSTVEKYEESTNEWVFVSSMNYPRCTLSAVPSSDFRNIFVMGGFDNGPLKTVERYSVIDNTWEIIQPMHFKRFMHAAVIVNRTK